MQYTTLLSAAMAAFASTATAIGVVGKAEGFATGVSGGGNAAPVYPSTTSELVSYLGDSSPRVIVLSKTFDFTGTEGTVTETGCAPWGTAAACQEAINANNWCNDYQKTAAKVQVTYDKAATSGITVNSHKTLIGDGSKGVIKGKGLRMANGVSNIIIQNIHITNLNPKYVWGGDAITLAGTNLVWIDHVTTSLIGRQHIVTGYQSSGKVTISNCDINGQTSWSATCDGHHYWALYFTGENDQITLKGNYIHHTSGRSPKVNEGTLLHAPNNYWYANSGHAFEGDDSYVLVEGSVFQNVNAPVQDFTGQLFTTPGGYESQCQSGLGRSCQQNAYGSSGAFNQKDTGFFSKFSGQTVASCAAASSAQSSVPNNAGFGKI